MAAKNYFYIVKHFPPRTKSCLHDYMGEVVQIASWMAGRSVKKISRATTISDDRDRTWVSVCVLTKYKTKLNHKYIAYDRDGNFEDTSVRFTQNAERKWYP